MAFRGGEVNGTDSGIQSTMTVNGGRKDGLHSTRKGGSLCSMISLRLALVPFSVSAVLLLMPQESRAQAASPSPTSAATPSTAPGVTPAVAAKKYLGDRFSGIVRNFGKRNQQQAQIVSGPAPVHMKRNQAAGKVWMVRLGDVPFKVSAEDKINLPVNACLARAQRLPAPYRRAFAIVSENDKDGIAVYSSLDGACAHGSQDYLNIIPTANPLVLAHECGHVLEQRHTRSKPDTLDRWEAAIRSDKISVSQYGDGARHEDLAEYAALYAICLDAGPNKLAELKALSPERFKIWEEILYQKP